MTSPASTSAARSPQPTKVGELPRPLRLGRRSGPRRRRSALEKTGIALLCVFGLMAAIGPAVAPYDPSQNTSAVLAPPSLNHLLGTTQTGQDVLSQLLVGARSSIVIALVSAAIATLISIVVGISSGYLRPVFAESLSAVTNVFLVLPALPLAIVIAAYLPTHGNLAVAVVVALTGWAWGARQLRVQTLSLRGRDFVTAARLSGESRARIIFFEIAPNVLPIILSSFLFTVLYAIVTQASLAFLGLVDISQWSWGTMLYWVQNFQAFTLGAWWWYIPPGLCIALFGTGLSLVSLGFDDRINRRLRVTGQARARRPRPSQSQESR
jgi:peptide/nickel transport system permease protein